MTGTFKRRPLKTALLNLTLVGASLLSTAPFLEAAVRVWDSYQAWSASQTRRSFQQAFASPPASHPAPLAASHPAPPAASRPAPPVASHPAPPVASHPAPPANSDAPRPAHPPGPAKPPAGPSSQIDSNRSESNEPRADWGWIVSDNDIGFRLHPDSPQFSARGSQAALANLPPAGVRVLILGDSVTHYGDSFGDTVPGRIEEILNNDPDAGPTEFLNSSIIGYTNYQELLWLKKYGLKWHPALVGVIFVMNDVFKFLHEVEIQGADRPPAAPGIAYAAPLPPPPGVETPATGDARLEFTTEAHAGMKSWVLWLGRHSRLLQVLHRDLAIIQATMKWHASRGYTFDYRAEFHSAWKDEPWLMIEEQMREMKQLARRHGFRVFLVAVPFGDQYNPEYLARNREYVLKPQRKLASICRSLEIPYLDLYDHITAREHFVEDRIHLNPEGRAAAARLIADFIGTNGLLPAREPVNPR